MAPLKIWALTAVILFLKMTALGLYQGYNRTRHKAFSKPEDAAFYGKGKPALAQELPAVQRAQGALRNDGENIPIFLALSLAYVMLKCWEPGVMIYCGIFVVARCLHSIFMVSPRQPWRTLVYATGLTISFVLSVHILLAVFSG